jgi:RNA polymerase sigma-70 factor (ECF subfamily)
MTGSFQRFPQTSEEFESFIMEHLDAFVRHAVGLLGNMEDAEDAVQEVILKIFRNRANLTGVSKPLNYVFRMITNSCTDIGRRKGCREAYIRRSLNEQKPEHEEPHEVSLIRREEYRHMQKMLDRLPEEQAVVIRFRFIEELSFSDIAEITASPVTTVKSRFSYGMNKLRSGFFQKRR